MTFEIVNHCHNYSRLLAYQLSSLVLYPPHVHRIIYTLYHEPSDLAVIETARYFHQRFPANITIQLRPQPVEVLRNRANGRDDAARASTADWTWFTDTDYLFLRVCWAELAEQLHARPEARFAAPLTLYETDWPAGDALVRAMNTPMVRDVDLGGMPRVRKRVAIGGLQIAHGPTVKRIGYCPELRGSRNRWDFKSDVRFRRQPEMASKIEVALNSVLRIRHSRRGYGEDLEGALN